MAERQGYENNDFTGGVSDEYVPTKDNRLDAAGNICLDDDLTPIQRPGSGKLTGADASFGKNAAQTTPVVGLIDGDDKLFAFSNSKAYLYPEGGPSFNSSVLEQDPSNVIFYTPKEYTQSLGVGGESATPYYDVGSSSWIYPFPTVTYVDPAPYTEKTSGSINGFLSREVVYAQNTQSSFTHKFLKTSYGGSGTDFSGNKILPVGVPRFPDQLLVSNPSQINPGASYLFGSSFGLVRKRPLAGPNPNGVDPIPKSGSPTVPSGAGSLNWHFSDKPYTYYVDAVGKEIVVKSTFAYKYLFCFAFRMTYVIDGITYTKTSQPCSPMYFLSDVSLLDVSLPNQPYFLECRIDLAAALSFMNQTHCPLFNTTNPEQGNVKFEIIPYLSDENGIVLKEVAQYYDGKTYGAGSVSSPAWYTEFNFNRYSATPNTWIYLQLWLTGTKAEDRIPLYTTGGTLPFSFPPPCKFIKNVGDFTYYANIKELEHTYAFPSIITDPQYKLKIYDVPYRLKQSNILDPDSVPEGNYVDFPDAITGVAAVLDRCVVGTTKEIYRVDGRFDDLGAGLVNTQLLSAETGCISHRSMVAVKDRLFFCGDDGIYVTDGVYVACISRHLTRTYRSLVASISTDTTGDLLTLNSNNQEKISATYDRAFDRVLFSFGNKILALELKASQIESGYGAFFGPWFTGLNETSAPDSFVSIAQYKNNIVRGDSLGYVYQFSPGYLSDPKTSGDAPSTWGRLPIIYRLRTLKLAMGSLVVKKWVSLLTFILKRRKVLTGGETNIDVQINAYNDGERVRQKLKPVHYAGAKDCVYDEDPKTGSISVPKFITDTLVNIQRRFGSSGLRCVTKAVEFTNGNYLVEKSDDLAQASVGGPGNLYVSLPSPLTWPKETQDINTKGYYISFDVDDYATKYAIVNDDGAQTLTLSSAGPIGTHKWKLYSYSTDQFFGLHSLGLVYTAFGSKHETYVLADQGGNTGDAGE